MVFIGVNRQALSATRDLPHIAGCSGIDHWSESQITVPARGWKINYGDGDGRDLDTKTLVTEGSGVNWCP